MYYLTKSREVKIFGWFFFTFRKSKQKTLVGGFVGGPKNLGPAPEANIFICTNAKSCFLMIFYMIFLINDQIFQKFSPAAGRKITKNIYRKYLWKLRPPTNQAGAGARTDLKIFPPLVLVPQAKFTNFRKNKRFRKTFTTFKNRIEVPFYWSPIF